MDTKFQKKHESDMTKKEKRKLEREKLKSMRFKEKLDYIFTYYKLPILLVILAIFAAVGIAKWAGHLQDEDMLYAAAINVMEEEGPIMEDFRKSIGDEDESHQYFLDTSIYTKEDGSMDYNTNMKLSTLLGAAQLHVLICPKQVYQQYAGDTDILFSISDLMGEEFVAEHGDICEKDAIRVENSQVLQKYGIVSGQPAYLIVFRYMKNPETAAQFVNFIME